MGEAAASRPVFHDRRREAQFRRDGYVVVSFIEPDEVKQLLDAYHRRDSGMDHGYYASMHSSDLDYKAAVDRDIRSLMWDRLSSMLVDHEPIVGAFMVKHPGPDGWVPPHQDWIVTDERVGGGINCWFPLTALDDEVGQMSVLRGSHRYLEGLRGSPSFPTQLGPISQVVADEFLEPVPLQVGQAIIYENRLLHGTPPNRSDKTRVVSYLSAMPAGATRVHYFRRDDGTVEGSRVGDDFFVDFNIGERPKGDVFVEIPDYDIAPLTVEELADRHRRANRPIARFTSRGYRDPALLQHAGG